MEPWIETYTGKKFWFDRYNPENITIEDIAHALSNVCRYSGHCNRYYSVAEHSYYVSFLVPPELALEGLLHDASEAYMADMPSPLKQLLPEYKNIEKEVMRQVAEKFSLEAGFDKYPEIKQADWAQLKIEAYHLLPSRGKEWYFPDSVGVGLVPHGYPPEIAVDLFLAKYKNLMKDKKND